MVYTFGASFGHSSMSMSPIVVFKVTCGYTDLATAHWWIIAADTYYMNFVTFPFVGGSRLYTLDISSLQAFWCQIKDRCMYNTMIVPSELLVFSHGHIDEGTKSDPRQLILGQYACPLLGAHTPDVCHRLWTMPQCGYHCWALKQASHTEMSWTPIHRDRNSQVGLSDVKQFKSWQ